MSTTTPSLRSVFAFAMAALGAGCGSDELVLPNEGVAATIAIVSGNPQTGVVGSALGQPLVVRVLDASNRPVQGQPITFSVVAGGGSIAPTSATTDATGQASATWTLGSGAGTQTAQAKATGNGAPDTLVARFSATASASGATTLAAVAGNNQAATAGSVLADDLVVVATDAGGNPVEGVAVTWSAGGGGSVSEASTVTGPNGQTGVKRTLGPSAGTQTTTATAGTLAGSPITFNSTATVGSAGSLTIERQPSSTAQAGVPFPVQPQVQLRDPNGNAVQAAGTAVSAEIATGPAGSSLIGNTTVATNAAGLATFSGLGITGPSGTYTINFSGVALTGATSSSVDVGAGAPARLAFGVQPSNVVSGAAITPPVTVVVQDALGNTVSGATTSVTLSIGTNPGGGSLSGTTTRAAANGVATFNNLSINAAGSGYTLVATGLPTTATSNPFNVGTGGATTIAANGGSGHTAVAGSAVATPPSVKVTDASGNPVAGRTVTFAVTGGGGSVSGATQATNAAGIATVGSWNLGPTAGQTNTLTATSAGLSGSPVTFTATSVAGSAGRLAILTQPATTAQSGVALTTQPVIQLQDANGNPVSTAGIAVTASIASGPGGGSLGNATVATNSAGRAVFSGLTVTGPSGTYTLAFGGNSLTGVTSGSIAVGSGGATKIGVVTAPPASVQSRAVFSPAPVVELRDASDNPVGTAGVTITAQIVSGGGTLTGTTSRVTDGQGRATFNDLAIQGTVGTRSIVFSSAGLTSTAGSSVAVTAGAVSDGPSDVSVAPSTITVGAATTVTVTVRDADGNPISGTVTPTATPMTGAFDAPSKLTDDGVARFTFTPSASGTYSIGAGVGSPSTTLTPVSLLVNPIATTTTVSAAPPSPSVVGTQVTFTATVAASGPTPTGTVQFTVDGVNAGAPQALSGGTATLVTSTLTVAGSPHTIGASYSGSATLGASSGSTTYTITAPPNSPPTAVPDNIGTILEDAPATTFNVIANDTDPDVGTVLSIFGGSVTAASNGTASVFSATHVSYAPAANFNGSDSFTYRASDGTAASTAATVSVTVTPVNDAPSFTKGPDRTVSAAAGAVTGAWATNISPGPANESAQTTVFTATIPAASAAVFTTPPAVSSTGVLSFTPAPRSTTVVVTVTVTLQDSGGTTAGGVNTSPAQTFTITVNP